MAEPGDITRLLRAYEAGDPDAFNRLVPLVYDELRRVARRHRRRGATATLQTTALVHEAYLKLANAENLQAADRGHLMAVAACAMRQVLIGRARARLRLKRGSGNEALPLEESQVAAPAASEWLLDVDRALDELRGRDERLARIFECRFFAGMGDEETAQALGIPLRTAQRGWMRARAWLREALGEPGEARARD
ncbi:MAG TPA: ECF-type sigma factor [Vicinamibacteria bacterium]|nr:ECF-type sigma factor [Vicinamibacteria bacterium]